MLNKSVARRYAEAFFSIAREREKIDQFQADMEQVLRALDEVEHLREYFSHLLIPAKDKKDVAQKLFADDLAQETMNFIFIIIDKRREAYFEAIYEEYVDMADESRNIKKAELFTATELSEEDLEELTKNLSHSLGKTVQLQTRVDPSLLGGVKVRIGDQIIDGTVAKKLEMLQEDLKQAKIS